MAEEWYLRDKNTIDRSIMENSRNNIASISDESKMSWE